MWIFSHSGFALMNAETGSAFEVELVSDSKASLILYSPTKTISMRVTSGTLEECRRVLEGIGRQLQATLPAVVP